jgi:hypothetical protein
MPTRFSEAPRARQPVRLSVSLSVCLQAAALREDAARWRSQAEAATKEAADARGAAAHAEAACASMARDRGVAADNLRKAEAEVDLINQSNEQMFRYVSPPPPPHTHTQKEGLL